MRLCTFDTDGALLKLGLGSEQNALCMDELLDKLNHLRKKYHQRALLKGIFLALGSLLVVALAFTILEFYTFLDKELRLVLLITYLIFLGLTLLRWVILPLGRMYGYFGPISYQRLAGLVGKEFPKAEDRILNALQFGSSVPEDALVQAALEQYQEKLRPVPFQRVIIWRDAWRFWPLAVIPVVIVSSLFLTGEGREILEGSKRIVRYSEDFQREAPFDFILLNDSLKAVEGADLRVRLRLQGAPIPREVYAHLGQEPLRMIRDSSGFFHIDFNNLRHSGEFYFSAASFRSSRYQVGVLDKPEFQEIRVEIQPPSYTGRRPKVIKYRPRISAPKGSKIGWQGKRSDNTTLYLETENSRLYYPDGKVDTVVSEDFNYRIGAQNSDISRFVIGPSRIKVQADRPPKIEANYELDSSQGQLLYFKVQYQDDYGISDLSLQLRRGDQRIRLRSYGSDDKSGELRGYLDLDSLDINQAGAVEVFFEVKDNDVLDGPKIGRSASYSWDHMSEEEKERARRENLSKASEGGEEVLAARRKLDKSLEELKQSMMQGKNLSWKEQQRVKELLQDLRELEQNSQEVKKRLREELKKEQADKDSLSVEEERMKELSEEEKELEKIKKEIEDLMSDLEKEKLEEKLRELQKENKQRLRQEERSQEMLEDLIFQRDVLKEAKRLQELAEKQENLADSGGINTEKDRQRKLREEMKSSLEKVKELGKKDEQLREELDKKGFEDSQDSAQKSMEEAMDKLENSDSEGANKAQKDASEEMKKMSQALQKSMMNMESKALEINMKSLRRILENLEVYSKGVEEAGEQIGDLEEGDPAYRRLLKEQERLAKGAAIIEDSLRLLSKKAPQIKEKVFEELEEMKGQLIKGKAHLQETETQKAATKLRYSMMAANELALLLEQSMQQMQQMMAMQKKGNQNCQKPGGSKPKPGAASKKLQKLGKRVQKLQKGQKPGQKGQKSQSGQKGQKGERGNRGSEGKEMAKILSEQEQLRRELEEMSKQEGPKGEKGDLSKAVEDMKQMERDLVNRDYDSYMERYRRIESRLLESEKAEMQRKQKEERIAERSSNLRQKQANPKLPRDAKDISMDEGLILLPLELKPFYHRRSLRP